MLITPAYAQTVADAGPLAGIIQFAPLIAIFALAYFMILRPQQTKQKELRTQLAALKRNDRVVTGGGILGTVTRVRDDSNEVEVEIAPNVRVLVARETINTVV